MILNQTPIRTVKNYKINNIEIDGLELPKNVQEFDRLSISGDVQNFEISNTAKKEPLAYGNGKELENWGYANANKNIKIKSYNKGNLNINFNFDEDNLNLVDNIEIYATSKSDTTIVIKYNSIEDIQCFHNGIVKVNAEKFAKINLIIVNLLNNQTKNFLSIQNELQENSEVTYTMIDLGGKTNITNWYSNVKGENSKACINAVYLGTGEQIFDLNYISELYGEKTKTNIEVQGALNDEAKKNFKGTIDFKKGCKKAIGDENEFCMLLSEKAKSKALPILLCTEEDIEGNHSTACGKVDNQELFYIMSRGLSYNDAMKLIVKAKFNKIIETIKDENLIEEITIEIEKKLS